MTRSTRIAAGAGVIIVVAAGVGALHVSPLLSVGLAYKAKMLCSGVFVAGGDPRAVLADLEIDDLAPLRYVRTVIAPSAGTVTASVPAIMSRRAAYRPRQGCALGADPASARDTVLASDGARPDPDWPAAVSAASPALAAALDRAFAEPDPARPRRTRAVVVVHRGQLIAERYAGADVGPDTPLHGWSMTKSVINALAGVAVGQSRIDLDRPLAVPEWQQPGDRRAAITLDQLLRMSSGLQFDEGMTSPASDPS
jgi:CubicO group peptidase (beta-lactamase class C family)